MVMCGVQHAVLTNGKSLVIEQCHQILTDGGLGDLVACLVAVNYNITYCKDIKFHVWVPDYLFWFAKHLLPKSTSIRPFSKAKEEFNPKLEGRTTEWCTDHTAIRTHPVDYGFHMLADRHVYSLKEKNYLQIKPEFIDISKFNLPEKYVVLAATGVEPVRTMPVDTANSIIGWLLDKNYTPVFLGKEDSNCGIGDHAIRANPIPLNYDKGINLINCTTLLESAKIIHQSKSYVGMDGGLTHVAGCTDAEIICGYTASNPNHVAPIRNGSQSYRFQAVEPDMGICNRYFQTYSGFKKGNFQKFENWEEVKASMTPDKFIIALENSLCET